MGITSASLSYRGVTRIVLISGLIGILLMSIPTNTIPRTPNQHVAADGYQPHLLYSINYASISQIATGHISSNPAEIRFTENVLTEQYEVTNPVWYQINGYDVRGPVDIYSRIGVPVPLDALIVHDPIVINSDSDFVSQAWPGEGIPGNPYIIEGLEITTVGDGRECIRIHNTRASFIVRSCHLIGGEWLGQRFGENGVKLYNVSNGVVQGNEINHHGDPGILIGNCSQCVIEDNYCYDNNRGIQASSSNHLTIMGNTISQEYGCISLSQCKSCTIKDNTPQGGAGGWGIMLDSCIEGNNTVMTNTISNNANGVYLTQSTNNTVYKNTCSNNGKSGIFLGTDVYYGGASNNIILNNTCENNVLFGIYANDGSNGNTIVNNTCWNNRYGIYMDGTMANILEDNHCESNDQGICIVDTEKTYVSMNNCTGNGYGIYTNTSLAVLIEGNLCEFNSYGVFIESDNATVLSNTCSNNTASGIIILSANLCRILSNDCIENGATGVLLQNSEDSTVEGNTCNNNTANGISLISFSSYDSILNNTCKYNPRGLYIYVSDRNNVTGNTFGFATYGIDSDGGWINIIADNLCSNCTVGIQMRNESRGATISGNICMGNQYGISILSNSYDSKLSKNHCYENQIGINIKSANTGWLGENALNDNTEVGVLLESLTSCTAVLNEITSNEVGIVLSSANSTYIGNNTITESTDVGVVFCGNTTGNNFHWNTCEDNAKPAEDNGTTNNLDYNYWSEYSGVDNNNDGFGDTPFAIDGAASNEDHFPLVYYPHAPQWSSIPHDQTIECGLTFTYTVSATAPSPIRWWVSDTEHFAIDASGQITNKTFLGFDEYELEVRAYSIYNASCSATIYVTVDDTTPPVVSSPADLTIDNPSGTLLSWTVYDLNPETCRIYLNGMLQTSSAWSTQSQEVSVDLGTMIIHAGTYVVMICAIDLAANNATDEVTVVVQEASTTTTTTGTTSGGEFTWPIDPSTMILLGGISLAAVVLVVVVVALRKRGS